MGKHVNIEESTVLFQNCCKTEITRRIKQHNPPFDMNFTLFVLGNIELKFPFRTLSSIYPLSVDALAILLPSYSCRCFRRPLTPFANSSTFSSPRLRALLKRSSDTQGAWLHLEHPRRLYRLNSSSRGLLDCFSVLRFECHCCCCFLHEVLENRFFKRNVVLE